MIMLRACTHSYASLERRQGEQSRSGNNHLHRNIANHSNMQEATETLARDSTQTQSSGIALELARICNVRT